MEWSTTIVATCLGLNIAMLAVNIINENGIGIAMSLVAAAVCAVVLSI